MEDNKQEERILTYLDGKMNQVEKSSFEQEMAGNPILQLEVDKFLRSKAAVFQHGKQAYKKQLKKEWDNWEHTQQASTIPLWRKVSIAASILLLFGLGLYFLQRSSQASPEELFAAHYVHPEAGAIRDLDPPNPNLITANQNYIKGEFGKAIRLYEEILADPAYQSDETRFYLGIAYLQEQQPDAAIAQLSQLSSEGFQASGQWYSVLALLHKGEVEQTRQACLALSQEKNHPYRQEAQELLRELD